MRLDALIRGHFDVGDDWEPGDRVSYFIPKRHLWVHIWTNRTFLKLTIRVRKGFEQPDLADILGVPLTDVKVKRKEIAIGTKSFEVKIRPDSNINFEALVHFLQTAHESVLEVWA